MTALATALRQKFRTAADAMKALGLDENLLQETRMSKKPTKFAATAAQLVAAVVGPLLAKDAKIDLTPVFADLTRKTFDKGKVKMALDAALKGKIAKDAEPNMGHVASMLEHIEHMSKPEVADESASSAQHNAMEAAAHGESKLDIPQKVGAEFADADKGKSFDAEPFKNFLKEKGMGDDDIARVCDMLPKPAPANGLDEDEEAKKKREEEEKKAADAKKAADEFALAEEKKKAEDKKAMDAKVLSNMVAKDEVNKMIQAAQAETRKTERAVQQALRDVKPWVGDLAGDMAFDSAEQVHRTAAKAIGIKRADAMHADALLDVIQAQPRPGFDNTNGGGSEPRRPALATDSASQDEFTKMFPGSDHIQTGPVN